MMRSRWMPWVLAPACAACVGPAPKPASRAEAAPVHASRPAAQAAPTAAPEAAAPSPRAEAGIFIRLRNAADTLELRSAYAVFPEDTVLFGDIPARGESAYHAVKRSYRYAYVRATAEGREWVLQPTDYVGEKPLGPGHYTWSIKPHDGPYPGFLDFEAARDR